MSWEGEFKWPWLFNDICSRCSQTVLLEMKSSHGLHKNSVLQCCFILNLYLTLRCGWGGVLQTEIRHFKSLCVWASKNHTQARCHFWLHLQQRRLSWIRYTHGYLVQRALEAGSCLLSHILCPYSLQKSKASKVFFSVFNGNSQSLKASLGKASA